MIIVDGYVKENINQKVFAYAAHKNGKYTVETTRERE
jgi:hypothetical protein